MTAGVKTKGLSGEMPPGGAGRNNNRRKALLQLPERHLRL